jgi:lysophospholipase L1-like esterase
MAAIGDSITQAFDSLGSKGILKTEPGSSWATGFSSRSKVNSQYLRLLAVDPAIKGREHNDSVVGATISSVGAQVAEAISQRAQYVVILIGANDACTHTISEMTPVRTFAESFATDLSTLISGLPRGAHVTVYSIPNLFRLWSLFHRKAAAQFAWTYTPTGICQSMLAKAGTSADRNAVLNREKAFNSGLAAACRKYSNCRWDHLAVFNDRYNAGDVNTLDYFHPSVTGQNRLAALTWAVSWWPALK